MKRTAYIIYIWISLWVIINGFFSSTTLSVIKMEVNRKVVNIAISDDIEHGLVATMDASVWVSWAVGGASVSHA